MRDEKRCDVVVGAGLRSSVENLPPFDLSALRYVLAAAEFRSFHRAAEALGTYPATISRSVRKVEDAIGVSLFERGAGGVRLTETGHRFASLAMAALCELRQATELAQASGRVEVGSVRVGVTTSLAGGFLRDLIADYKARHPGVAIEVHDGSPIDHISRVRDRLLDAAFVKDAGNIPDCVAKPLWTERIFVAMAAGHKLAGRSHLDWCDLTQERFIATRADPGGEIRSYIRRRLSDRGGDAAVHLKPVQRETLMHMVGLGDGITLVSEAWMSMSFPNVVLLPLAGSADVLTLYMVWAPRNDNPALRRFISRAHVLAAAAGRGLQRERT